MVTRKPVLAGTSCVAKAKIDALNKGDRNKLNLADLTPVESVDIDQCFEKAEANANRWDYYISFSKNGEIYVEVHEVSEAELARLTAKADWLKQKILSLGWPQTEGRPLLLAPTKGITPFSAYGELSKRLALQKMVIVMKGTRIADLL